MSETAIVTREIDASVLEKVTIQGDLSGLSPAERVNYYRRVCESLGLNPFTKPFDYITLNGKLTLYAKRDAADQLRKINRVSVIIASRDTLGDVYIVTARASLPDGRQDESTGAVSIKGLAGEPLANAFMKAETKAKRRVTLSIVGLGWLDETETQSIPNAKPVTVDMETGEIVTPDTPAPSQDLSPAKMSIEMAGEVTNDHGVRYDTLDDATLNNMANTMQAVLDGKKQSKHSREDIQFRRDACLTILASRNG